MLRIAATRLAPVIMFWTRLPTGTIKSSHITAVIMDMSAVAVAKNSSAGNLYIYYLTIITMPRVLKRYLNGLLL